MSHVVFLNHRNPKKKKDIQTSNIAGKHMVVQLYRKYFTAREKEVAMGEGLKLKRTVHNCRVCLRRGDEQSFQ